MNAEIDTSNTDKPVTNILVPVKLTEAYLSVIRQAAELAKQHGACIHLLHLQDLNQFRQSFFPWLVRHQEFQEAIIRQKAILNTWQRWLETEYGLVVTATMDWGKWDKAVLHHITARSADLVILQADKGDKKWYRFWQTPLEEIIEKSPCQVITFFPARAASLSGSMS